MNIVELLMLAVGLSMDAFAASICKGLALNRIRLSHSIIVGLWFGTFQALMPMLGWLLSSFSSTYIIKFGKLLSVIILILIGINMIREAFSPEEEPLSAALTLGAMLPLAFATSADAFATGVTLSFYGANILMSAAIIGFTTFLLSAIGVKVGNSFGLRHKTRAETLGGATLILLALKLLADCFTQR